MSYRLRFAALQPLGFAERLTRRDIIAAAGHAGSTPASSLILSLASLLGPCSFSRSRNDGDPYRISAPFSIPALIYAHSLIFHHLSPFFCLSKYVSAPHRRFICMAVERPQLSKRQASVQPLLRKRARSRRARGTVTAKTTRLTLRAQVSGFCAARRALTASGWASAYSPDLHCASSSGGSSLSLCVENRAAVAGQPEHICQLTEAGGSWRLP